MIIAGITSCPVTVSERVCICPGDFEELVFLRGIHDTVLHDPSQILRCSVMNSVLILRVQPVGRNKVCGSTSELFCFLVHHIRKALNAPSHMLRDRNGRIIVGLQHQRIEKIFQIKFLPVFHAQLYLRLGRGFLAHADRFVKISFLQRQDTGHDLGRACHGHLFPAVLRK